MTSIDRIAFIRNFSAPLFYSIINTFTQKENKQTWFTYAQNATSENRYVPLFYMQNSGTIPLLNCLDLFSYS